MANVHDVAAYVLSRLGGMSAMKLQKLCYYSQAWHLVWFRKPLFPERIEAWANGPVIRELYDLHRGRFLVDSWPAGHPESLAADEREAVDAVIEAYGELDGRKLSHLTHAEDPWRNARGNLPSTARSEREITLESMEAYYSIVDTADDATPVDELDWGPWEEASPPAATG